MTELLLAVEGFLANSGVQSLFLQVFILGLFTAIPVGPWSMVTMEQTIKHGRKHGLFMGLSATLGNIAIAAVAAYFFTFLYDFMQSHINAIYIFTSILLLTFGAYFLFKKKEKKVVTANPVTKWARFILGWFGIKGETFDIAHERLMRSHIATYIITFVWSFSHPGNIMTYLVLCFIMQGLGADFGNISISSDFLLPLFLSTLLMWSSWVIIGSNLQRFLHPVLKGFGLLFVVVGCHMFYSNAF